MEKLGIKKFLDKKIENLRVVNGGCPSNTRWSNESGAGGQDNYDENGHITYDDQFTNVWDS